MQTTDMGSLLKILESPMGAGLLPMVHSRENLMMDQNKASLQDTIARTQLAQQEEMRKQQMHPLQMERETAATRGQVLTNQDNEFKGGVRDALGQGHYVAAERGKVTANDVRIASEASRLFTNAAGTISAMPKMAPGMMRAEAIRILKANKQDALIPTVEQMPEEMIGPTLKQMAEATAGLSRQAFVENIKQEGATARTTATNENRLIIAGDKNRTIENIARIRAEVQKSVAAARASGGRTDKVTNANLAARYYNEGTQLWQQAQALEQAGRGGEAENLYAQAEQTMRRAEDFSKLLKAKTVGPETESVEETTFGDGKMTTVKKKRPVAPPRDKSNPQDVPDDQFKVLRPQTK